MILPRFSVLEFEFALLALDALERRDSHLEAAVGHRLEPYRNDQQAGQLDRDVLKPDRTGVLDLTQGGLVLGQWTVDQFRYGLRLGAEVLLYVQRFALRGEPVPADLPSQFVDLVIGMAIQGSGPGRVAVEGSTVAVSDRVALILGSPIGRRAIVRSLLADGASVVATNLFFADLRRVGIDPIPDVVESAEWTGRRAVVPARHIRLERCCIVAVSSTADAPVGEELPAAWLQALLERYASTDADTVERLAALLGERPSALVTDAHITRSRDAVMRLLTRE